MTRTQGIYLFGLLAIVAAAFVVWAMFAKPSAIGTPEVHVLPATLTPEGDYQYVEDADYYRIEARYPAHTVLDDTAADKLARAHIETELAAAIAQFKSENRLDILTPEDIQIQGLGGDRRYTLTMEYKTYAGEGTVSYVYSIYMDTLGAHPNGFYRTFVFDKRGGALSLEELFAPGSRYLDRLSAAAYSQVLAQLKQKAGNVTLQMEEDARMGTEPSPEALQFFYLEDGELHLLFPPYQVAAYAAGSFDAVVSLADLADILKPDFK